MCPYRHVCRAVCAFRLPLEAGAAVHVGQQLPPPHSLCWCKTRHGFMENTFSQSSTTLSWPDFQFQYSHPVRRRRCRWRWGSVPPTGPRVVRRAAAWAPACASAPPRLQSPPRAVTTRPGGSLMNGFATSATRIEVCAVTCASAPPLPRPRRRCAATKRPGGFVFKMVKTAISISQIPKGFVLSFGVLPFGNQHADRRRTGNACFAACISNLHNWLP